MHLKSFCLKTMAVCALLSLSACTTADSLMSRSLLKGTAKNNKAALELTQFIAESAYPKCPALKTLAQTGQLTADDLKDCYTPGKVARDAKQENLRRWAIRGLSFFEEVPEATLTILGRRLIDDETSDTEKVWSAFALGHFQRKETIPYFLQAITLQPSKNQAYFILEALSRQVGIFTNDQQLSVELLTSLNTYISKTKHTPPTMYNLLNEYISTISTLVLAMDNIIEQHPADKRGKEDFLELYSGIYNLFRAMELQHDKLLANYAANESNLEKAFDVAYKGLDKKYQPAFLLYTWYAGELSDNPELSTIASKKLLAWLDSGDTHLRGLVIWALMRMELYNSPTREALLKHLSKTETDEHILYMLANYRYFRGEPDVIQQLRGLEIAK